MYYSVFLYIINVQPDIEQIYAADFKKKQL